MDHQRAIVIISMGQQAAKSNLVERFVFSARTLGKYQGYIVLLTDAPTGRYDNILTLQQYGVDKNNSNSVDNHFVVLKPLSRHYRTDFQQRDMVFKRFKTFVLEYMTMEPRLRDVRLVYYLDVDIVVTKPMQDFFYRLEEQYAIGATEEEENDNNKTYTANVNQTMSTMWMFEGNYKKFKIQGGQIILDIAKSAGCLERWRQLIDKNWKTRKDQFPLMEMWKDQAKYYSKTRKSDKSKSAQILGCKIVRMAQNGNIYFPTKPEINQHVSHILSGQGWSTTSHHNSTLIHLRNTDSSGKKLNRTFYEIFVRDILQFTSNQDDPLGITKRHIIAAQRSDMVVTPDSQSSM